MGVVLAVMQFVGGGFVGVVFDHDLLLDVMLSFFLVMELHTLLPFVYPRSTPMAPISSEYCHREDPRW
jgi:hypothetical protein